MTFAVVATLGTGTALSAGLLRDNSAVPADAPVDTAPMTPMPTPSASAPPATTPPPTVPAEPTSGATEIPDGLRLPHEGEVSNDPDTTDWRTVDELTTGWPWLVCGVDSYTGDSSRTDFRMVLTEGPEYFPRNTLAVYSDAAAAVSVMADMRAAIMDCSDGETVGGFDSWEIAPLQIGGESFLAAATSFTPFGERASGGDVVGVVRLGNAIYAGYQHEDGQPSLAGAVAAGVVTELTAFAPQMCVFTVAGC